MTPVDRLSSPRGLDDLEVAGCGAMWGDVTGGLPNYLTGSNDPSYEATCQSGYGAVCKTAYPGSIPGVASIEDKSAFHRA